MICWRAGSAYAHADLQQTEPVDRGIRTGPAVRASSPLQRAARRSATRVEVLGTSEATGWTRRLDDRAAQRPPADRRPGRPRRRRLHRALVALSQVDGHRWQGVYRFGVGRTPPPTDGAPAALPSPFELAIQWGALLATAFVLGGLAFKIWALEPALLASAPRRRRSNGSGGRSRWRWCLLAWSASERRRQLRPVLDRPASRHGNLRRPRESRRPGLAAPVAGPDDRLPGRARRLDRHGGGVRCAAGADPWPGRPCRCRWARAGPGGHHPPDRGRAWLGGAFAFAVSLPLLRPGASSGSASGRGSVRAACPGCCRPRDRERHR